MLFHITARVRVTGQARPANRPGRDRVLHAFACPLSASRRKKGRKTLTFPVLETAWRPESWRNIWGSMEAPSVEENLVDLETRPRDWCPGQRTIGRHRSSLDDRRKYSPFFFGHFLRDKAVLLFLFLLILTAVFLFGEQNVAALLQSLLRRTQP